MHFHKAEKSLLETVALLSVQSDLETRMKPCACNIGQYPSVEKLKEIISIVKAVVFPEYFDKRYDSAAFRAHYIGVSVERLYSLLQKEIAMSLCFRSGHGEGEAYEPAANQATAFINALPEIKRLLLTDVEAMFNNDPAADNYAEVILSYPTINAMVHYRTAHALLKLGIPVIPRIITELAHSATGIDINPGATIGEYFAIDHGTGVVIGETAIVGSHVNLYQGVTLGAKSFSYDSEGHPVKIPRHPIIEDNVTIYSNATILGRITIGRGSVIGGNVWLTHSVPPGSKIIQR